MYAGIILCSVPSELVVLWGRRAAAPGRPMGMESILNQSHKLLSGYAMPILGLGVDATYT